jgi:hypothetical protein
MACARANAGKEGAPKGTFLSHPMKELETIMRDKNCLVDNYGCSSVDDCVRVFNKLEDIIDRLEDRIQELEMSAGIVQENSEACPDSDPEWR